MNPSDPALDARLKQVPLPAGLSERLRAIADWDDDTLDAALCDVPVPPPLIENLLAAERPIAVLPDGLSDPNLDRSLSEIPIPAGLVKRLQATRRASSPIRWSRVAVAASLMLICGSSFLFGLTWLVDSVHRDAVARHELRVRGGEVWREVATVTMISPADDQPPASPPAPPERSPGRRENEADPSWETIELVSLTAPLPGPADEMFGQWERGHRELWSELLPLHWGALGAPTVSHDLPELETGPRAAALGVEPPLVAGIDRSFVYRHGSHPPVSPAGHASLRKTTLPLAADVESYQRAARRVAEGRLPQSGEIRVEDFLAGMPYAFPPPAQGAVGLRTAAGQSPFDQQSVLLQIGVQAATQVRRQRPATHLTLAIDGSESMRWQGRMQHVRGALQQLIEQLGPRDRISVVVFNERITQHVEGATRDDKEVLQSVLTNLRARGGTNLFLGLQQSLTLALEPLVSETLPRQLVLLTDGQLDLPLATAQRCRQLVQQGQQEGVEFRVMDLSGQTEVRPSLMELARQPEGGSLVFPARTDDELYWALLEALSGSSPLMAEDLQLQMEFNPQAVAAYRLVGHDPSPLTSIEEPAGVRLRSGQAATVLLELWLQPSDADLLGWVELQWRDPSDGSQSQLRQRVSRIQVASSFRETPLSLQAAAIAAETAEVLREGHRFFISESGRYDHRAVPSTLEHVLEASERVNPRLAERPGFQRFVTFLRQAEAIQSGRGAP